MFTRAHAWLAGMALFLAACTTPPASPTAAVSKAPAVDWHRLDPWQATLAANETVQQIERRFAPNNAWRGFFEFNPRALFVLEHAADRTTFYQLRYRTTNTPPLPPPAGARYWRTRDELGPAPPGRPLDGLRVALDPGHLGGSFGPMEGRSFSVDGRPPVQEGDLALRVAQLLKPRLEALGAQVSFVRDHPGPVTTDTPESLRPQAEAQWLAGAAVEFNGVIPPPGDPRRESEIKRLSETLFYRVSEIEARARKVNDVLRPDIVLCLHLDAVDWPDPKKPTLVPQQHFHILVNGAYSAAELSSDEQRLDMVERIASGAATEELAAAQSMAEGAAPVFDLPAFGYAGANATALGGNGYVWGRNLLANRLYQCPVVFFEPYVMNSVEGYERIQAGEYSGTRVFNGQERKNIFEEYADAVVAGLIKYYSARPPAQPPADAAPAP